MTPQQRAKMEELAEQYASTLISHSHEEWRKYYLAHKAGFTAAIEMQNGAEVITNDELKVGYLVLIEDQAKQIAQLQAQRDDYERAWKETQQARVELAQQIVQLQQEVERLKTDVKIKDSTYESLFDRYYETKLELEAIEKVYQMNRNYVEESKLKLAASQERERVLREALEDISHRSKKTDGGLVYMPYSFLPEHAKKALAQTEEVKHGKT